IEARKRLAARRADSLLQGAPRPVDRIRIDIGTDLACDIGFRRQSDGKRTEGMFQCLVCRDFARKTDQSRQKSRLLAAHDGMGGIYKRLAEERVECLPA